MNLNGGNKQLPLLLQPSKLPPINELLKTSVGLLRPVNLTPSVTTSLPINGGSGTASVSLSGGSSGAFPVAAMPQQLFRYPYGMPAHRPLILNPLVPQTSSTKAIYAVSTQPSPYRALTAMVDPVTRAPIPVSCNSISFPPRPTVVSSGGTVVIVKDNQTAPPVIVVRPDVGSLDNCQQLNVKTELPVVSTNNAVKLENINAPTLCRLLNDDPLLPTIFCSPPQLSKLDCSPLQLPNVESPLQLPSCNLQSQTDACNTLHSEPPVLTPPVEVSKAMSSSSSIESFTVVQNISSQSESTIAPAPQEAEENISKEEKLEKKPRRRTVQTGRKLMLKKSTPRLSPLPSVKKKPHKKLHGRTASSLGNKQRNTRTPSRLSETVSPSKVAAHEEVGKLTKELGLVRRAEGILKGELKLVRDKLLNETRQRDVERSKNESASAAMKNELGQLKKRLSAAEANAASLSKKNNALSIELASLKALHGMAEDNDDAPELPANSISSEQSKMLVDSLSSLVEDINVMYQKNQAELKKKPQFAERCSSINAVAQKIIAQLNGCKDGGPDVKLVDGLHVSATVFENYRNQTGRVLRSNIKRTLAAETSCREKSNVMDKLNNSAASSDLGSDVENSTVTDDSDEAFKFYCHHCTEYSTETWRYLLRHLSRRHNVRPDIFSVLSNNTTTCSVCSTTTPDVLQLAVHHVRQHFSKAHAKKQISPGKFYCQFSGCSFSSVNQWDLFEHIATSHLQQETACPTKKEAVEMDDCEDEPLRAAKLAKSATDSNANVSSSSTSSRPGSASSCGHMICVCHHCPYRTERVSDMKKHAARRHQDAEAYDRREATESDAECNNDIMFRCGFCPNRYFRPGDLKKHRRICSAYLKAQRLGTAVEVKNKQVAMKSKVHACRRSFKFLSPKLNLAARVHARWARAFFLKKMKKLWANRAAEQHALPLDLSSLDVIQPLSPQCIIEVTDLFHGSPPSPDLALLISHSDIKMLCDSANDVEQLLGEEL